MTTHRIAPTRAALGVAAAAAALSIGAPAAGAATGVDPAVYQTGVAPGTVVHGVEAVTVTGSKDPIAHRVEFWVGADRWREQTTDAKSGKSLSARIHDASGTTEISYRSPAGYPLVVHLKGSDSVPGPGWPAPYNKRLLAGLRQSNATHSWIASLRAIGPVTIASIAGTKYELLTNGAPEANKHDQHTYLTLDADAQPLARETTQQNGGRTFDQLETLTSREVVPAAGVTQLTTRSLHASIKAWKSTAAKAKARARKHHG